jgi:hypothetical protein
MTRPAYSLASLALAAIAVLATPGYAKTPKRLADALDEYGRAARSTLPIWLAESVTELARAGAEAPAKRDKIHVRRRLKRCLSHPDMRVRVAAARAYGLLALPRSSRDLRHIVEHAEDHPLELVEAAFDAWARIHDPGTHEALLDYIRIPSHKKEERALAQAAARAMPGYMGLTGRSRYEMLRDLMKTFDYIYASAQSPSSAALRWWMVLAPELVASFNELTALRLETYKECWTWWRRYHRKVRAGKA